MKNKYYILPIFIGLSLALGLILGRQLANFYIPKPPPPVPMPITDIDTVPENPYKVKLGKLIDYIEEDYVDKVNTDSIVDLTINSILRKLDPHSTYISKTDIQAVQQVNPHIYIFIALLGIISGAALISYTLASTILPFNLLGLLGYVEPCVMLLISFLIGEKLNPNAYILMSCLLIAVLLLILDGIQAVRRSHRKYKAQMKVK